MFFDTNKIHIQAFVDFITGKLIIFRSSSPQNYFEVIYSTNIYKKLIPNINTKTKFKTEGLGFDFFDFFGLKFPSIIFSRMFPYTF